jgi:NADP-reducing hydrogenase subunit HndC
MKNPQNIYKSHVFVCVSGKTCPQEGAQEVFDALRKSVSEHGLKTSVRINKAGCLDQCGNGPVLVVYPEGTWYARVRPEDCQEIVESHLIGGQAVERLLYDGRGKVI